jgi:alpha-methylacyl-CoA racemase
LTRARDNEPDQQGNRPPLLVGIRVVTLATNLPGPAAAAQLCRLGANVTKVEPPGGDPMAVHCPIWYKALASGQTVISLDLKNPDDFRKLGKILEASDLLLTSSRPAALERLSLGWKRIHAKYPRLCQAALVGHAAPNENVPGHDLTYQAAWGLVDPPNLPRTLMADLASAERLMSTGLALLLARKRTGIGEYAQVAIADVARQFAEPLRHGLTIPGGPLGGRTPGYHLYRASDGWIAIAALEPHFWEKVKSELQLEAGDYEELASRFLARTGADWEKWAAEHDLPIVAVR